MEKRKRYRRRRCRHCGDWYEPNSRAARRQKFCNKAECQKARCRRTSRTWRRHNPHTKDEQDAARIRVWRRKHPGYWRKHRRRWLIFDFLVPLAALKKTRFLVKLSDPKSGALRILDLVQRTGRPCVLKELVESLRISIGHAPCPCYRASVCQKCVLAGRREEKRRKREQRHERRSTDRTSRRLL